MDCATGPSVAGPDCYAASMEPSIDPLVDGTLVEIVFHAGRPVRRYRSGWVALALVVEEPDWIHLVDFDPRDDARLLVGVRWPTRATPRVVRMLLDKDRRAIPVGCLVDPHEPDSGLVLADDPLGWSLSGHGRWGLADAVRAPVALWQTIGLDLDALSTDLALT